MTILVQAKKAVPESTRDSNVSSLSTPFFYLHRFDFYHLEKPTPLILSTHFYINNSFLLCQPIFLQFLQAMDLRMVKNNKKNLALVVALIFGILLFNGHEGKSQEKQDDTAYWREEVKVPRSMLLEIYLNSMLRHDFDGFFGRRFHFEKNKIHCFITISKSTSFESVEQEKKTMQMIVSISSFKLGEKIPVEFHVNVYKEK